MKFNPYPVLITTGALMWGTIMFAQTGSSVALLKAGAASVDRDVSSFAAKALSTLGNRPSADDERRVRDVRVASLVEKDTLTRE